MESPFACCGLMSGKRRISPARGCVGANVLEGHRERCSLFVSACVFLFVGDKIAGALLRSLHPSLADSLARSLHCKVVGDGTRPRAVACREGRRFATF